MEKVLGYIIKLIWQLEWRLCMNGKELRFDD